MIALGRALAARGHDVTLQTWRRWERHVEAEGMAFAPAPEYHVFPTRERPLDPYEAVVRAAADTRAARAARCAPTPSSPTSSRSPRRSPASSRGCRCATLIPHVDPRGEPRLPAVLARRAAAAQRTGPRAVAGRATAAACAGSSAAARAQRDPRARLGLPPLAHVHGGIIARARARRDASRSSSTRAPRRAARRTSSGRSVGAARRRRRAAARRRSARARRAVDVAGPEHRMLRAALRGPRRRAGARARDVEPPPAGAAAPRPRQRPSRRVGVLRAHDARAATSSSATPATARSRARWPAAAPSSRARRSAT